MPIPMGFSLWSMAQNCFCQLPSRVQVGKAAKNRGVICGMSAACSWLINCGDHRMENSEKRHRSFNHRKMLNIFTQFYNSISITISINNWNQLISIFNILNCWTSSSLSISETNWMISWMRRDMKRYLAFQPFQKMSVGIDSPFAVLLLLQVWSNSSLPIDGLLTPHWPIQDLMR